MGDFETGDLTGWTKTGTAFNLNPTVTDGGGLFSGWECKWYANSRTTGEVATGTLTSAPFELTEQHISFLISGEGYFAATISIWVKIGLLWAMTVTGMLWEKEMYGHYFMCKEFFWEDLGNLIAMLSHNAYFVVKWLGWGQKEIMLVMCFAYITYLFNFGQFTFRWAKSRRQRRQAKDK